MMRSGQGDKMSKLENIMFSVNQYDKDGDLVDPAGIFLNFGDNVSIRVASDLEGYDDFIATLKRLKPQIKDVFNESNGG